jgi:hypothetical protein
MQYQIRVKCPDMPFDKGFMPIRAMQIEFRLPSFPPTARLDLNLIFDVGPDSVNHIDNQFWMLNDELECVGFATGGTVELSFFGVRIIPKSVPFRPAITGMKPNLFSQKRQAA